MVFSLAIVLAAGVIVYLIQRARGVDLSATIHELDVSPPEAEAGAALAAGFAGKVLPPEGTVTGTTADPPAERGGGTLD